MSVAQIKDEAPGWQRELASIDKNKYTDTKIKYTYLEANVGRAH